MKTLFNSNNVEFKVVELDNVSDGAELQEALHQLTGRKTVPNVFVGGSTIGGSDDTFKLHDSGKLMPRLERLGVISKKKSPQDTDRPEL